MQWEMDMGRKVWNEMKVQFVKMMTGWTRDMKETLEKDRKIIKVNITF